MHIPACSDIFRHIQVYSGIIQAYSEPIVTLAYSEALHTQKPGIFRGLRYSESAAYSETLSNIYDRKFCENC